MKKMSAMLLALIFVLTYMPVFAVEQVSSSESTKGEIVVETYELIGDKSASINYTYIGSNCRNTAIKLVPAE